MLERVRWALALLLVSCGGDATPVVAAPHVSASAAAVAPPAPRGAKWVFVTPEKGLRDALPLGDGSTLYVGEHGRRELVASGAVKHAGALAPDTLVAARKEDDGALAFVTDDAAVYVAKEPLGDFTAVRKGPGEVRSLAVGKKALFAVLSDGRLVRSTDLGATWSDASYGPKTYGHASSIAMTHDGKGLLVHVPQRVYMTADDGATWAPLGATADGAARAEADASGNLYVRGFGGWSKLDGGVLVPVQEGPQPLVMPVPSVESSPANDSTVRVIAGDRVVALEQRAKSVFVSRAKLGERPAAAVEVPELATTDSLSMRVSAYGPHVVVLRSDPGSDENTPTSTVMRSDDEGLTWRADVTLGGKRPPAGGRLLVAAGPRGWTYVSALCSSSSERREHNCDHRKVRPAGATSFEDMVFAEEIGPLQGVVFDEPHDKVYLLANRPSGESTQFGAALAVFESPLERNQFTRVALEVPYEGWITPVMSVDSAGTLHVFTYDPTKAAYAVHRRDASNKNLPTLWLPIRSLHGRVEPMVFGGTHGVLFTGETSGWETADAGETWARVAANGAKDPLCSDAGCIMGDTQRIGWDLPALADAGGEKLVAVAEIAEETHRPSRDKPKPAEAPPLSLVCSASGTSAAVLRPPDMVRSRGNIDWLVPDAHDADVAVVVGARSTVRRMPMFQPAPAKSKRTVGTRRVDPGFIAARYDAHDDAGKSPVDVELAWISTDTGAVHHGQLPKLDPFRLSQWGFSGDAEIVRGGLLYQSTDAAPLFFLHDDGKVERMTLPAHASLSHAFQIGGSWVLFDTNEAHMAQLSWSADNGKTWQQRAWALADVGGSRPELLTGEQAMIGVDDPRDGIALFPVTVPPPAELGAPRPLDLSVPMDAPCDARATAGYAFTISEGLGSVHATLGGRTLSAMERFAHVTPAAGICASGYDFGDSSLHLEVVRDDKGAWSGWAFTAGKDHKWTAEPATCKVSP